MIRLEVKAGSFVFKDNLALDQLLKIGLIGKYDVSPQAREAHDEAMATKYHRPSPRWSGVIGFQEFCSRPFRQSRPLGEGEVIHNPWRQ